MPSTRHALALPAILALTIAAVAGPTACARFPGSDPESRSHDARIRSLLTASAEPVLALATGDTVHFGDEVKSFYEARAYQAAWTDEEGFLPRGQALVSALRKADEEGLDLSAYHGDEISPPLARAKRDVEQKLLVGGVLGGLDLLLTEAYLRYTTDVLRGTIDPGAEALAMKAVVGKTGNETPIFRDTLDQIVVNPYWNVPPKIAANEILPLLERDPGYLARNHMEFVGRARTAGSGSGPDTATRSAWSSSCSPRTSTGACASTRTSTGATRGSSAWPATS